MAKISFQPNPTFKLDVEIPRVGGTTIKVAFVFNYLDRDQMATILDADIQYSKALQESVKEDDSCAREISAKAEEYQFEQIQKVVTGWGFSEELNDDNIRALVRSASAVPVAILEAYKGAYTKVREGN